MWAFHHPLGERISSTQWISSVEDGFHPPTADFMNLGLSQSDKPKFEVPSLHCMLFPHILSMEGHSHTALAIPTPILRMKNAVTPRSLNLNKEISEKISKRA